VEGTLVDILTDAVSFFGKDGIDGGGSGGTKIECGHNIKSGGCRKRG
jgi:hypothetical protein